MDPIARTACYCCGIRAADAARPQPICGDRFAATFIDADAHAVIDRFKGFRGPNAANVVRHRIIDDLLRLRLNERRDARVLLLGAGFDTRAYRLAGGRWFEFDQPALIARKEAMLPTAGAANPLVRIPIDFAHEALADKLDVLGRDGGPVIVVLEGVSMYLDPPQLAASLAALRAAFPVHVLICDLMTAAFARRWSRGLRREIARLGGEFGALQDDPVAFVEGCGYRCVDTISIARRAAELDAIPIPGFVLDTLLRSLRDGYRVHVFEGRSETG